MAHRSGFALILLTLVVLIAAGTATASEKLLPRLPAFCSVIHAADSHAAASAAGTPEPVAKSSMPWWGWPLILFVVTFILASSRCSRCGRACSMSRSSVFLPFNLDFVAARLMVALAGALAAGPAS